MELWRERKVGVKTFKIIVTMVGKNCFGTYSLHLSLFSADYQHDLYSSKYSTWRGHSKT